MLVSVSRYEKVHGLVTAMYLALRLHVFQILKCVPWTDIESELKHMTGNWSQITKDGYMQCKMSADGFLLWVV